MPLLPGGGVDTDGDAADPTAAAAAAAGGGGGVSGAAEAPESTSAASAATAAAPPIVEVPPAPTPAACSPAAPPVPPASPPLAFLLPPPPPPSLIRPPTSTSIAKGPARGRGGFSRPASLGPAASPASDFRAGSQKAAWSEDMLEKKVKTAWAAQPSALWAALLVSEAAWPRGAASSPSRRINAGEEERRGA